MVGSETSDVRNTVNSGSSGKVRIIACNILKIFSPKEGIFSSGLLFYHLGLTHPAKRTKQEEKCVIYQNYDKFVAAFT
jgi:hypothetical protein